MAGGWEWFKTTYDSKYTTYNNTERRQYEGMGAGAKKGWAGGGGKMKEVGGARVILCKILPIAL